MKAQKIINYLLLNGKTDLPQWEREEFIAVAMQDFNISKQTAKKVYTGYHAAIDNKKD